MDDIYLGNPNLKKANVAQEFSAEQIEEFMRCAGDPVYFAKTYMKIVSLDEGLVQFSPYDFQEKLIKNFHENRFNICKMPRQTGKRVNGFNSLILSMVPFSLMNAISRGILVSFIWKDFCPASSKTKSIPLS